MSMSTSEQCEMIEIPWWSCNFPNTYIPPKVVLKPKKKPRVNFDRFKTADEAMGAFIMEFYKGNDDAWEADTNVRATKLLNWLFAPPGKLE